jgi:outer membrane lipoprotein SlyB
MQTAQTAQAVQTANRWSWVVVPRAVWLGAAAFGIAVVSAGAAMWLQPAPVTPVAAERALQPETPAVEAKPQSSVPLAQTKATPATPAAPVCTTCGVVESVQAVQRKGEGTGLGAVAGGVVGGVVGNQIGKGNGRKAMTVLGAVGGGFAGHEIEKRARAETVYSVRVRMNDGTLRTVTRQQPVAVGARVTVKGQTLRVAQSSSEASGS